MFAPFYLIGYSVSDKNICFIICLLNRRHGQTVVKEETLELLLRTVELNECSSDVGSGDRDRYGLVNSLAP